MSNPRSFLDGRVTLHAGDCREVLRGMADNSVDSVVTDPPYHLQSIVKRFGGENAAPAKHGTDVAFKRASSGFMSKTWDGGDIAFQTELWAEVLRVLKPGGYIMAFSGCRTYHRMACAIEDAGFITHPMFAWCFGSGFPKAHSVSKQIDRAAGAEREVIGVAGCSGVPEVGYSRNSKSEYFETMHATTAAREWDGWFYGTQSVKPAIEPVYFGQKPFEKGLNGAQNVLKWGVGAINVGACKVQTTPRTTHARGDIRGKSANVYNGGWREQFETPGRDSRWPANLIHDGSDEVLACFPERGLSHGDSGSAARFFASFPQDDGQRIFYTSKAGADDRLGSRHPTVKPLDLIQYFVRLITPTNGVCLDLFAGTGTTGEACFREGFRSILIERESEYLADIERRMGLVMEGPVTRAHTGMKARGRPRDDGPLFGGDAVQQRFRNVAAGFEGEERRKREASE